MSLIENSISPLIDQRLKQCQATHSMKKNFHTAKPAEYAMLIQYYMTQKDWMHYRDGQLTGFAY